jgi:hypothetical protein
MDGALLIARTTAPGLEVQVETGALDPERLALLRERRHPLVVTTRESRNACLADPALRWVGSSHLAAL